MKDEKIELVDSLMQGLNREETNRQVYLEEFERLTDRFGIEVSLDEDRDRDEVYSEWEEHVNMSASELQRWSRNPCSREASLDPQAVIKRNLRLLEKNKEDWTENDYKDAERTISFISRMRGMRPESPREGPHGCPSEWAISLLNWAYNPFDSVPEPSKESKKDLEPVEEVALQDRRNIKEAEVLAEEVWALKDVMQEFRDEFEEVARKLETEKSEEDVEQLRERVSKAVSLLRTRISSPAEDVEEEMQDGVHSYEFEPVPDQVLYSTEELAEQRAESMGLEGSHEHLFGEDDTVMYMAGSEHMDWAEKVGHPRQLEMQESEFAYESGDKVKWSSSGGTAMGVIRKRTSDSCYDDEIDGDVKVCGEPDEPAYLIEIFDDEEGELTGTMVGHKEDTLEEAGFEMSADTRQAAQVFHGDQEKHLSDDEDEESVRVPPVAIHKVESGDAVEVSEDVEEALERLWDE